jgi:DNA repair exonuclease SbcCD nuclease subunit
VTRLLVFGDLHLGAGTVLGREPGDRLRDQEQVLDLIREAALEHDVDAILDAGDTFEGPQVTPEQLAVFARFVGDSREAGFPVVAISGNGKHDAAMRHVNGVDIFQHVPGVTVYSRPGLYDLGGCQVACLPWVSPARLVASVGGDVDRDRVNACAAELLVQVAAVLADPTIKPTVLMLHGSISGASLPTGISTDDLREPVIPIEELLDLGYAAIIASHIHVPQVTVPPANQWEDPECFGDGTEWSAPFALYTGSPLPLNFGETGVAHGVWILDVAAQRTRAEFVPIESRPLVQIDVADPASWDDVAGAIVKARVAGTRTELRNLDLAAIRSDLLESGAHTVKIETETIREDRARVAGVTEDLEPLEAFDAWVAANEIVAPEARAQMQADLEAVGT